MIQAFRLFFFRRKTLSKRKIHPEKATGNFQSLDIIETFSCFLSYRFWKNPVFPTKLAFLQTIERPAKTCSGRKKRSAQRSAGYSR